MRKITIDFTAENRLPDGSILGKQGEHNATQLVIIPPSEMTECEEITSYRIAFGLTNCRCVHSENIEKSEEVSMLLFSQITLSETVEIQLEGYSIDGDLVMKSETIKKFKFLPSVCGKETDLNGDSQSLAKEVNLNALARHTHENKDVLDLIGQDGENLTFNGKEITASASCSGNFKVTAAQVASEMLTTNNVTVVSCKPSEAINNEDYTNFFWSLIAHTYIIFVPIEDGELQCFSTETYDFSETIDIFAGQMLIWYYNMSGELNRYLKQGKEIRDVLINGLESLS